MHAAPTGESVVTPSCWRDTPHLHNRQGLPHGQRTRYLNSGSDISPAQARQLLDDLTALIVRAGAEIGAASPATVVRRLKPDQSPVTAADEASEAVILRGLARILPNVPVVAEESVDATASPDLTGSFVIVDPLDGTREFLVGRDEFTVNLAIVTHGLPVAGIIAAPKLGKLWRGVIGYGAERLRLSGDAADRPEAISTRSWPDAPVAVVSRSHMDSTTDKFVSRLGPITRVPCGSAIKFCHVAEGSADIYPRLATTCEWDVAAGHALVVAAGGIVTAPLGIPLTYGRAAENFRVPAFVAWGDSGKAAAVKTRS
jgi:3'(2'), 5'-bisphosphate nucleotidase